MLDQGEQRVGCRGEPRCSSARCRHLRVVALLCRLRELRGCGKGHLLCRSITCLFELKKQDRTAASKHKVESWEFNSASVGSCPRRRPAPTQTTRGRRSPRWEGPCSFQSSAEAS